MSSSRPPQQIYKWPKPGSAWWKTRKGAMLNLLRDCKWHTQAECLAASKHRFGGVIDVLRKEGWEIETRNLPGGTETYEYRLVHLTKGKSQSRRRRLYLSQHAVEMLADGILIDEVCEVAAEVLGEEEP